MVLPAVLFFFARDIICMRSYYFGEIILRKDGAESRKEENICIKSEIRKASLLHIGHLQQMQFNPKRASPRWSRKRKNMAARIGNCALLLLCKDSGAHAAPDDREKVLRRTLPTTVSFSSLLRLA